MEKIDELYFYAHTLSVYGTIEEPLFVAVEVARMIDYSAGNTYWMLEMVPSYEKLVLDILRAGQRRRTLMLTENGLYEVLMRSSKPVAREFRRFVKLELLNLRKARKETISQFALYWERSSDLERLNRYRLSQNLAPLSFEEFLALEEDGIDPELYDPILQ